MKSGADRANGVGRNGMERTMDVHLEPQDVDALIEVLTETIPDLSPEIADTDNPGYRQMLLQRRTRLETVLAKLRSATQRTSADHTNAVHG